MVSARVCGSSLAASTTKRTGRADADPTPPAPWLNPAWSHLPGEETLIRGDEKLPGDAFALSIRNIWEVIRSQKDLNLPAHKVRGGTGRSEAPAASRCSVAGRGHHCLCDRAAVWEGRTTRLCADAESRSAQGLCGYWR